jgi:hypothetical protein
MKPSPSKSMKTAARKKRSREEAAGSTEGSTPPTSPSRPNPNKEWKKSKEKTEDLLVLVNSGFLREKEVDMWRATAGDPYPMEKNPDEIPMFTRFVERGLALPASDFFKSLLNYYDIEYVNLNPNGIFHVSVFIQFCEAFLGIKPHWVLFRKFFRVKPQPSSNDPRVVGRASIQMREDTAEQYLAYKLIDSNQDWKSKWFYISNHHPELPKPSGKQSKHQAWWNMEPTMQEGIQLPELLQKIKALREARLRAEHAAFSFMKMRVQPLMARDTLGYQYTGEDDTLWMPGGEIDDDDIVERLGRIFKDMPSYMPCPVPEYSAAHPPSKVSSRTQCPSTDCMVVVMLTKAICCRVILQSLSLSQLGLLNLSISQKRRKARPRSVTKSVKVTTPSSLKIRLTRRTRRRSRSGSSCGPSSAARDCPTCPSSRIHRLAWRLVYLRRRGGRSTWHASASPKS